MRQILNLNKNWQFSKTSVIPNIYPSWEQVDLPHTWNAKDGQDGGNDYWRGTACYVKKLIRPEIRAGSRIYLEVNGAAMIAEVFFNGEKLARHEGGAHGLNQKGIVSFDRKLKKDAFYLYKAAWNKTEDFVHLCGSRYVNRAEEETEIKVYSNRPQVTLLVDGKEAGTQTGKTVFTFKVRLTGEHTITAFSGNCNDIMVIRKADQPDASYRFGQAGSVSNWFDEEDFRTDCFSIKDSFGVLMAHKEAGKIVGALMAKIVESRGDVAKSANSNANLQKMMAAMSFESLLKKAGDTVPEELARSINEQLQKIKK